LVLDSGRRPRGHPPADHVAGGDDRQARGLIDEAGVEVDP
jgi:hypothetical protein